ncbi:hypothetical protein BDN67DRAFT_530740 [Paxillus ammoniavirescens]|nr:hypothetical protein BDN67DRAFT_530740 [Paxillus ammoniavirescens]
MIPRMRRTSGFKLASHLKAHLKISRPSGRAWYSPQRMSSATGLYEIPESRLTFTHSGPFQWSRQHRIADCNRVPGTSFLRGQNPPAERNVGFNAQQYPQYGTGDTARGRITIDFWNNRRITGVVRVQ